MGLFDAIGNITGSLISANASKNASKRNAAMQREFAQQGIRWKVADAKAAGIHPLYALGASTTSFSPSYVGADYSGLGRGLGEMGQDISRAVNATRTEDERREAEASAFMLNAVRNSDSRVALAEEKVKQDRAWALRMQNAELQNTLLASQIMRINHAPNPSFPSADTPRHRFDDSQLWDVVGPGVHTVGSKTQAAPVGAVSIGPSKVTSSDPADRSKEAGTTPGVKEYRIGGDSGATLRLPSQQMAESLEGIPGGAFGAMIADYVMRKVGGVGKPAQNLLPAGYEWTWNVWSQSWSATKKGK